MEKDNILSFSDGKGVFSFQVKISDNIRQDEDTGYLYCDNAILGRTGVQEYYAHELGLGKNEIIKVNRMAEDVFADEAMASYEGKSITWYHPVGKKVTSKNYKDLDVGTILKVWQDGDNVRGNIVIKDADLIMDVLDGTIKELSLGYKAKFIPIENGEYKQTEFVINHLAVVKKGRAKNAQIVDEDSIEKENKKMKLFDLFKGKKLQINDDDTVTMVEDGMQVVYKETMTSKEEYPDYEDKTATIVTERKSETIRTKVTPDVVKDEEVKVEVTPVVETTVDPTVDEEQKKKEIQDMEKEELKVLFADLKAEMLVELKAELATNKAKEVQDSVFKKVEVIDTKDEKTEKGLTLDFARDEELRKIYWDKMTNPASHGGDFKALNAFVRKANALTVR